MKERPIIFSGPMVRAILEGRKTQTRRIVKPQPPNHSWSVLPGYKLHAHVDVTDGKIGLRFHHSVERQDAKDSLHQDENWIVCPLGKPGDLLWVKETWRSWKRLCDEDSYDDEHEHDDHCAQTYVAYRATPRIGYRPVPDRATITFLHESSPIESDRRLLGPWKPAIHMPRWASRITLEITDVRVERLNDISEEGARAEGITDGGCGNCGCSEPCECPNPNPLPIDGFIDSWESTHGAGSWHENPWVWVYTFKRVD